MKPKQQEPFPPVVLTMAELQKKRVYIPEQPHYPRYPLNRQAIRRQHRQRLLKACPKCFYCNVELDDTTATIDHVFPLAKGGKDHPTNYVLACRPCNVAKGDAV